MIACYNADGTLDKNFGSGGITTTDFGFDDDRANAVALQSDGSIVAAGYSANGNDKDYAVARYLPNLKLGVIDRPLPKQNLIIYPNPVHGSSQIEYELTHSQPVTIKLFDMLGNERAAFINEEIRNAGKNTEHLVFGNDLPSGCYQFVIKTQKGTVSVNIIKD